MELTHEIKEGKIQVDVLYVSGRVDGSNFTELITKARQVIDGGSGYLLLDMAACDFLSSAGMFALHSIALIAHQLEPLDPEAGWHALHSMKREVDRNVKEKFKVVNMQPNVTHTLEISGISSFLDIYTDSQEALEAFGLKQS